MRLTILCVALAASSLAPAQVNISFVGQLDYQALHNSTIANLWGYTDETGTEYALVGVCGTNAQNPGGISVVSLADPANPQEVFFYEGPASLWREIKVWGDHAYMTTEAEDGGLVIVDLSPLPQSTALPAITWLAPDWDNSHSLFIDENGRLYLHGANRGNQGVIMYDLTQDPMDPVEVGAYDAYYCHDSFARGDTLYSAHISDGFFHIVDVSDPENPVWLGTQTTPNAFTHNTWLDDSGHYLFTTDERTNAYVTAYDVSDPTDIQEVCRLRSDNGSGAIPHNTYWLNDYVVQSYYTYGVSIYDATDPHNMVEVGSYDTSPFTGDGFYGAWGVYPFFDSQRLIISDIEHGLFVLDPTYVLACRLEGSVTDAQTTAPVANAVLTIEGGPTAEATGIDGAYVTGYHTAGSYTIHVTAFGYAPFTLENVVLVNGQVTYQDIVLAPLIPFSMHGDVISQGSSAPIPGSDVHFYSPTYNYEGQSDGTGIYDLPAFFEDAYSVTAGHWGWRTQCFPAQTFNAGSSNFTITLPVGYYDDMYFDFGWTVVGSASDGEWERGVPVGTANDGAQSNPAADVADDCGSEAFVTGNGVGGVGSDDVDGGYTELTSPVFDATALPDPHVRYRRWFYNGGGTGIPNDSYTISLDNGVTIVALETITAGTAGMSSWQEADFAIADFLAPTDHMRLIARAVENNPGHLVEAGLDRFEVVDVNTSAVGERSTNTLRLWPNPNDGRFRMLLPAGTLGNLELIDATGRIVHQQRVTMETTIDARGLPPGTYSARAVSSDGSTYRAAVVVVP